MLQASRNRVRAIVESHLFQNSIITIIVMNAIILGLETSQSVMGSAFGPILSALDKIALYVFVVELVLRIYAYGWRFFRGAWNWFDFIIVAISFMPASNASVLRALRILRAFRLISAVPKMRGIVDAIVRSIPSLFSVLFLLALLFYVFSVMATKLYAATFPDWFGSVGESLYTLFQVMTLESWSMGIVRPVLEVHPNAWTFFVPFILITSFAVLNLFIAVIVNAMDDAKHGEEQEDLHATVKRLEEKLDALTEKLNED